MPCRRGLGWSARHARVRAVERVVDRAAAALMEKRVGGRDVPAVLVGAVDVEDGGIHARVQTRRAELVQHDGRALGKVRLENPCRAWRSNSAA